MQRKNRVTAHAVAHTATQRMITALSRFGDNVRDSADLMRYAFVYFDSNVQPWKRAAMWVCLAVNLLLAFALARLGNPVSFVALFGSWSALNYLDNTEVWGLRGSK